MSRTTHSQRGFSLIELLIVVIIAALAFTGLALSLGATSRAKLRSSCWTLVAGIRYAYSRAVTAGTTTRIVMDFSGRTFAIEETEGRVVLSRDDETGEGVRRDEDKDGDPNRSDPDAGPGSFGGGGLFGGGGGGGLMSMMGMGFGSDDGDEGNELSDIMSNMTQPGGITDPFLATMQDHEGANAAGYRRARFTSLAGKRGEPRQLEGRTEFITVFTPHEPEPRTDGKAYVYFFPRGLTEHSIIQMSDGDDRIYSIEIHPLTGQSIIHNEAIEPENELDELQEADE